MKAPVHPRGIHDDDPLSLVARAHLAAFETAFSLTKKKKTAFSAPSFFVAALHAPQCFMRQQVQGNECFHIQNVDEFIP